MNNLLIDWNQSKLFELPKKKQWSQCLLKHLFSQFNPIFCHKAHIVWSSRYKATNFQINCHKTIVQTQNMHIRIFWLLKNEEKTKTNFVYLNNTYYSNGKKNWNKKTYLFLSIFREHLPPVLCRFWWSCALHFQSTQRKIVLSN